MSFDVHQLDTFLLVGSAVTFLAILAVRLSSGAGLPSLLIYLLMGVVLGESGLGIEFEDAELAHALGFAALALILAEGGLTTSWREAKPSMRLGLSLATIGVAISVASWPSAPTSCWACRGSCRCCSARSAHRPTQPRCFRCCVWCHSRNGWSAPSRPSPVSTTRPPSSW